MDNSLQPQGAGNILLYQTEDGKVTVDVLFEGETVWLTQSQMATLFNTTKQNISLHINNAFKEGEISPEATVKESLTVQKEGQREISRRVKYYNLDVIISVGYRVKSLRGTQFRIWATEQLREYIIKGFVLNDELLKNGKKFGKDYFDELLERIREIRASERRAYQKIADVFEQCSADYDPSSEETKLFYAFVQNKMHYAVTGQTAAEIIYERADSAKPHMGLSTWKNSPSGKIMKSDVVIAKNYLNKHEISLMNRLVTAFIDFAELRALSRRIVTMREWLERTDEFLKFAEQPVLQSAGHTTHEQAIQKASREYAKFREQQDKEYFSPFDIELEKYLNDRDDTID